MMARISLIFFSLFFIHACAQIKQVQKIPGNEDEEFPWLVAILAAFDNNCGEKTKSYICGGSLISQNIILTSSSCIINRPADKLTVRTGNWESQKIIGSGNFTDRTVEKIITHEKYHKDALFNDVGLLILEKYYLIQTNITVVNLPALSTSIDVKHCFAPSWNKGKFLEKINLSVVPQSDCQKSLRKTQLGPDFKLHESFLCAGAENVDTCKDDGGFPLFCPSLAANNTYYQVGIVSWGIGCGKENVPGVYANVLHLLPWINKHLTAFPA